MGQGSLGAPQTAEIAGMGKVPVASPNAIDSTGAQFVSDKINLIQQMGQAMYGVGEGNLMGNTKPPIYASTGYVPEDTSSWQHFKQHPFQRIGEGFMAAGSPETYEALKRSRAEQHFNAWKETESPQAKMMTELYKKYYGDMINPNEQQTTGILEDFDWNSVEGFDPQKGFNPIKQRILRNKKTGTYKLVDTEE